MIKEIESQPNYKIRCLPALDNQQYKPRRYPVSYYLSYNEIKVIFLPIGSTSCSTDCYSHLQYPDYQLSMQKNCCPVCKHPFKQNEYLFIDIGLLNLLRNYENFIYENNYGWVILDENGLIINWESAKNPLLDSLVTYTTEQIMQNTPLNKCLGFKTQLNYLNLNKEIKRYFGKINHELAKHNNNRIITWCRAKLDTSQNFKGLILNTQKRPNKFVYYRFMTEVGQSNYLKGKKTHIHYIPSYNIFFIVAVDFPRAPNQPILKTAYVIDLTQSLLNDKTNLFLIPVEFNILPSRQQFCTCYDRETNMIYIYGGRGVDKQTFQTQQVINAEISWNGKQFKYTKKPSVQFQKGYFLSCCTFAYSGNDKVLIVGGGYQKAEGQEKKILSGFIYRKFNQDGSLANFTGNYDNKIACYSNIISIPKIIYDNKEETLPGILYFGGTPNEDSGIEREKYQSFYLTTFLQPKGNSTIKLQATSSNSNYSFLCDNSSILLKTSKDQYLIRMLIPAKRSGSKDTKTRAYLLEYNIRNKSMKQTQLLADDILEFD